MIDDLKELPKRPGTEAVGDHVIMSLANTFADFRSLVARNS